LGIEIHLAMVRRASKAIQPPSKKRERERRGHTTQICIIEKKNLMISICGKLKSTIREILINGKVDSCNLHVNTILFLLPLSRWIESVCGVYSAWMLLFFGLEKGDEENISHRVHLNEPACTCFIEIKQ
jgi:hypothetical protein